MWDDPARCHGVQRESSRASGQLASRYHNHADACNDGSYSYADSTGSVDGNPDGGGQRIASATSFGDSYAVAFTYAFARTGEANPNTRACKRDAIAFTYAFRQAAGDGEQHQQH